MKRRQGIIIYNVKKNFSNKSKILFDIKKA
jgi:hypothetical protein